MLPTTTTIPGARDLADFGLSPPPPLADDLPATGRWWQPEAQLRLGIAEQHAIGECMTGKGFEYPVALDGWVVGFGAWLPDDFLSVRRGGAATEFGYHLDDWMDPAAAAVAGLDEAATADFWEALTGGDSAPVVPITRPDGTETGAQVQRGGCAVSAAAVTGGIEFNQEAFRGDVEAAVGQRGTEMARTDARVLDALAAWMTCVETGVGESAETPDQLARRFAFEGATPSAREIEVAVRDVECQAAADLQLVWFTVVTEYERAMMGDQVATYDQLLRLRVDALAVVDAYLAANDLVPPSLG